jgi:hypothetical protein
VRIRDVAIDDVPIERARARKRVRDLDEQCVAQRVLDAPAHAASRFAIVAFTRAHNAFGMRMWNLSS